MSLSEQLSNILHDLEHMTPEMAILAVALLVLIVGLFKIPSEVTKAIAGLGMVLVFFHVGSKAEILFDGMIVQSPLTFNFIKLFCFTILVLVFFKTTNNQKSSYYFILLIVAFGAIMMMQSMHLLLLYLGIEMVSYGSYALTNFSFNRKSHEAGIKYLLFGGVTSAIMLFGMSMLYGSVGSMLINDLSGLNMYGQAGAIMLVSGILFKISAVPFHIWTPNVYQSAPIDTTAFLSIVPKLAGLVVLKNTLSAFGWGHELILGLGILTVIVGTLGATRQSNVRRLISYGAIANTGFLIPFVVLDIPIHLFVWYAVVYALMNIGIFYLIGLFEANDKYELRDYSGLGKYIPTIGVLFAVVLVALIGLPPTAGFTAKWFLFSSLWSSFQADSNPLLMTYLLTSVFATAVALYYYLRIPYYLFLKEGSTTLGLKIRTHIVLPIVISLLLVALFFLPNILLPQ